MSSEILTRGVPFIMDTWHPKVEGMPTYYFTVRQYDSQWNELERHPFSFLANNTRTRISLDPVEGGSGIRIGDSFCAFIEVIDPGPLVPVPEAGTVGAMAFVALATIWSVIGKRKKTKK